MGKWSRREYDCQLVSKIEKLFEQSLGDPLLDLPEDRRFNSFIRHLDPDDKAVQACFQTLVQQILRGKRCPRPSRDESPPRRRPAYRRGLTRPPEEFLRSTQEAANFLYANDPHAPRDGSSREPLFLDPRSPSGERAQTLPRIRLTSPPSSRPLSPDPLNLAAPRPRASSARRRSASPSFSPSRALARTADAAAAQEGDNPDRPTPLSPSGAARDAPRSPSRVWLDEYISRQTGRQPTPDDAASGVPQRRRGNTRPSFLPEASASYLDTLPGRRRRGRDEDPDDGDMSTGRRVRPRNAYRTAHELDSWHNPFAEPSRDTRRDGVVIPGEYLAEEEGYIDFNPLEGMPYPYEAEFDFVSLNDLAGQDPLGLDSDYHQRYDQTNFDAGW